MATTSAADSKPVGTVDAQPAESTRTTVADVVTADLRLTDWAVFRTVAECSEATIHRLYD
jgi:hypothetical protein